MPVTVELLFNLRQPECGLKKSWKSYDDLLKHVHATYAPKGDYCLVCDDEPFTQEVFSQARKEGAELKVYIRKHKGEYAGFPSIKSEMESRWLLDSLLKEKYLAKEEKERLNVKIQPAAILVRKRPPPKPKVKSLKDMNLNETGGLNSTADIHAEQQQQAYKDKVALEVKGRHLLPMFKEWKLDEIREILCGEVDVTLADEEHKNTALHMACVMGEMDIIERIIMLGANINAQNVHGETPLMAAMNYNEPKVALLMLHFNPDVNLRDNKGVTALMRAIRMECEDRRKLVDTIIRLGADVNAQDNYGVAAIHIAIGCKEPKILRRLLENGADPTVAAFDTTRPLQYATDGGHPEMIELLFEFKNGRNIGENVYKATLLTEKAMTKLSKISA